MLTLKDLCQIYEAHASEYDTQIPGFSIGNKAFDFNQRTAILGIINLSKDSWWNHAICYTPEQAINRGRMLTAQGADIIDIGTEATSSKASRTEEESQIEQLKPLLQTFSQENILTSVETYYPSVAEATLKLGANVINFTGIEDSEEMYRVVADHDAAIIICYMQGKHARDIGDFDFSAAHDPTLLLYDFFAKEIEVATKLGIKKIFIDPAIGLSYSNFYYKHEYLSRRMRYQIDTLLTAFRLRKLGFPVFNQIPTALEVFGEELRSAQVFTAVFAALGKSDILRTHEVAKVRAVLDAMASY
ncbi:MAG TPA: dihydropteroate synthase [Nodularia sp. (in: cyanobacteria)]|nr:dihydropteroate synthase [Nodularia sp. (in: cyanobacteria)]